MPGTSANGRAASARGKEAKSMPAFRPPKVATINSIDLSHGQFKKLSSLVYSLCGIHLGDDKRDLLKARLAKRFRAIGVCGVNDYIARLEDDKQGAELVCFLDCITTNKTDFFREPQHFDFVARRLFPQANDLCHQGEGLRIWSAACSTGEEPYTLAMVALENKAQLAGRRVEILASDLSTRVLAQAERGVYALDRVSGMPRNILTSYFQKGVRSWEGHVRVRPEVRGMVAYKRINLMDRFNFERPFHAIFCRNVMIYFDKETRSRLVNKFKACLPKGGYLFVGHSESLTGIEHNLKFVQPAVYRKEG